MSPLDIGIVAVVAVLVLSFLPWGKVKGLLPSKKLDRMACLQAIVVAMDTCDSHGHKELADKLEDLLPEAAKCIRGS